MSPREPKTYKDAKTYAESFEKLPAGAYVVKTQNAKIETNEYNGVTYERLVIAFDIIEGEFAGHYQRRFDSDTGETKKWKGTIRISIPGESEEADSISNRMHKTCITALEDSNEKFHHQWLEDNAKYAAQFKDLVVGAVFREREYDYEGRTGFFTECLRFADVEKVRAGEIKTPAPKYLDGSKSSKASTDTGSKTSADVDLDDMPF